MEKTEPSDPRSQVIPNGSVIMRFLQRLLSFLVFAALIAAVGYLLAERNTQRFRLKAERDTSVQAQKKEHYILVVERGRFLPLGFEPMVRPTEVSLYAPIPIPSKQLLPSIPSTVFQNQSELDTALFALLEEWVRQGLHQANAPTRPWVETYIERATQLPAISEKQRQRLTQLRADAAYHEGVRLRAAFLNAYAQSIEAFERAAAGPSEYEAEAEMHLKTLRSETPLADVILSAPTQVGVTTSERTADTSAPTPAKASSPTAPKAGGAQKGRGQSATSAAQAAPPTDALKAAPGTEARNDTLLGVTTKNETP